MYIMPTIYTRVRHRRIRLVPVRQPGASSRRCHQVLLLLSPHVSCVSINLLLKTHCITYIHSAQEAQTHKSSQASTSSPQRQRQIFISFLLPLPLDPHHHCEHTHTRRHHQSTMTKMKGIATTTTTTTTGAAATAAAAAVAPSSFPTTLEYQQGFGNHFSTEALPGALPQGQNTPQVCPLGTYICICVCVYVN